MVIEHCRNLEFHLRKNGKIFVLNGEASVIEVVVYPIVKILYTNALNLENVALFFRNDVSNRLETLTTLHFRNVILHEAYFHDVERAFEKIESITIETVAIFQSIAKNAQNLKKLWVKATKNGSWLFAENYINLERVIFNQWTYKKEKVLNLNFCLQRHDKLKHIECDYSEVLLNKDDLLNSDFVLDTLSVSWDLNVIKWLIKADDIVKAIKNL